MENKSKELEVAIASALEAGKIIEKYFETEILKELKEDKSIVTLADKESEDVIKKIILNEFPNHSILGEETGMTKNSGEHVWHIDRWHEKLCQWYSTFCRFYCSGVSQ